MKYPYRVELIEEADGERCWVARSESLKGCIGTGDTPEEAAKELEENEVAWLETAQEYGTEIPAVPYERAESFSGKFTVRVSSYVHRAAAEEAKKQGVSLNQFINDAIVNYVAETKTIDYVSDAVTVKTQEIVRSKINSEPSGLANFFSMSMAFTGKASYPYDASGRRSRATA